MNPTNDLLARYLQAIGEHLPAATRDDVLAELRANLQAQIDDRAEELNRPLTDPDVAAILKDHGRPEFVAARYLPQRYLIGPALFPFYLLTLSRVLPFVVAIYFIANLVRIAVIQNGLGSIAEGLVGSAFHLVPVLFVWLGVLTIIFAVIERTYARLGKTWNLDWNPSKLPAVKPSDAKERSIPARIADLAFHCLWMAYILEIPRHPFLMFGPAVSYVASLPITWAPAWHTFYVGFWFLLLLQLGLKIANFFDALGRWRIPLDLIAKLYNIALAAWLASTGTYVIATGPGVDPLHLAIANHWVGLSIAIALVFLTLDVCVQAWKYFRTRIPMSRLAF